LGRKKGSYKFEKRQRELKKQKKRQEKLERRHKRAEEEEYLPPEGFPDTPSEENSETES
jgi:hypothetical protein